MWVNRKLENSKTCCRIYVGSPPQTTTINTRHTPPNNNYHNHSQHHQQQHQPSQPSQPTESTTPSHRVRLARLRPCPVRLGASSGLHLGQRHQLTSHSEPASQRQRSASRPPSKQAPRHTMPANTASAPLTVMR